MAFFSPDSELLVTDTGRPGVLAVYHVGGASGDPSGEPVAQLDATADGAKVTTARFAASGRTLVALAEGSTRARAWTWSGAPGPAGGDVEVTDLAVPPSTGDPIVDVAPGPDGRRVVGRLQDSATVLLWDVVGGASAPLALDFADEEVAEWSSFAPGGAHLVVGYGSGSVGIWNLTARPPEADALRDPRGEIVQASFSENGRWLVTVNARAEARAWLVEAGDLVDEARRLASGAAADVSP